jgi:hypothetical protein
MCVLCKEKEDVDHLLFTCPMAEFVWSFMSESLEWDGYPVSMTDLLDVSLPGKFGASFQLGLSYFAGMA